MTGVPSTTASTAGWPGRIATPRTTIRPQRLQHAGGVVAAAGAGAGDHEHEVALARGAPDCASSAAGVVGQDRQAPGRAPASRASPSSIIDVGVGELAVAPAPLPAGRSSSPGRQDRDARPRAHRQLGVPAGGCKREVGRAEPAARRATSSSPAATSSPAGADVARAPGRGVPTRAVAVVEQVDLLDADDGVARRPAADRRCRPARTAPARGTTGARSATSAARTAMPSIAAAGAAGCRARRADVGTRRSVRARRRPRRLRLRRRQRGGPPRARRPRGERALGRSAGGPAGRGSAVTRSAPV